jgi:hypothetical protein
MAGFGTTSLVGLGPTIEGIVQPVRSRIRKTISKRFTFIRFGLLTFELGVVVRSNLLAA